MTVKSATQMRNVFRLDGYMKKMKITKPNPVGNSVLNPYAGKIKPASVIQGYSEGTLPRDLVSAISWIQSQYLQKNVNTAIINDHLMFKAILEHLSNVVNIDVIMIDGQLSLEQLKLLREMNPESLFAFCEIEVHYGSLTPILPFLSSDNCSIVDLKTERAFKPAENRMGCISRVFRNTKQAEDEFLTQIKQEIHGLNFNYEREDLVSISHKKKWFGDMKSKDIMKLKACAISNKAVLYMMSSDIADNYGSESEIELSIDLLPRYKNGKIQSFNLVILNEDETEVEEIYSVYVPDLVYTKNKDVIYFKRWSGGMMDNSWYRKEDDVIHEITAGNPISTQEVSYGKLPKLGQMAVMMGFNDMLKCYSRRLSVYIDYFKSVMKDAENKLTDKEIKEEAIAQYFGDFKETNTDKFIVTKTSFFPSLTNARIQSRRLAKRKMAPHDRKAHKNYRYGPNGEVVKEWDVDAIEINGGIKARYGMQISSLSK